MRDEYSTVLFRLRFPLFIFPCSYFGWFDSVILARLASEFMWIFLSLLLRSIIIAIFFFFPNFPWFTTKHALERYIHALRHFDWLHLEMSIVEWVDWTLCAPAQLIKANNPFQSSFGQNKYMLHEMQFYGISYFPSIHIGLNAFNTYDKNERNVTTIMNVME